MSRDEEFFFDQGTVTRMCPKCVLSSPFESISVTYTRDRSAYVVDLLLAPEESTAFTRQGSLVQSQSRPPFY